MTYSIKIIDQSPPFRDGMECITDFTIVLHRNGEPLGPLSCFVVHKWDENGKWTQNEYGEIINGIPQINDLGGGVVELITEDERPLLIEDCDIEELEAFLSEMTPIFPAPTYHQVMAELQQLGGVVLGDYCGAGLVLAWNGKYKAWPTAQDVIAACAETGADEREMVGLFSVLTSTC